MRTLVIGLLTFSLVAANTIGDDKKDETLLQGTWKLVEGERNGEKPPKEFLEAFKITFKGDTVLPEGAGGERESTYKLDTTSKPRRIDIKSAENADRTMKGIYELSGDTLKICFSSPGSETYPTEFSGKAGSNAMNMVFKKQK